MKNLNKTAEKDLYKLTSEQESSIKASRNQIKDGKFHKNEDVISEMREWLKKK